jgi:uracil-DNA glycosylase family protein
MKASPQLDLLAPKPPVAPAIDPERFARTQDAITAGLAGCQRCNLHTAATQAVMGVGKQGATLMLVGEQPGNDEDLAGKPFVGPAGKLLRQALATAQIPDAELYITNAVKHFKWVAQGRRRLHQKPNVSEVRACKPWLEQEIAAVQPKLIVCLGATSAQSLLGSGFRVTQSRGIVLASPLGPAFATIHPSAILRMPDPDIQAQALEAFTQDLKRAFAWAQSGAPLPD